MMAAAQQACRCWVLDESTQEKRERNGAAVALAFDKARYRGFYMKFGKMTSILQGQWVVRKDKYKQMKILLVIGHLVL